MFDVICLSRAVGRQDACLPEDVLPLKLALYRLGYYRPDPATGWHPRFDGALAAAIDAFQSAESLQCGGTVQPDGDLLACLNRRLQDVRTRAEAGRPAVAPADGRAAYVDSRPAEVRPFCLDAGSGGIANGVGNGGGNGAANGAGMSGEANGAARRPGAPLPHVRAA